MDMGEEDEMADFIVDEEDVDDSGVPKYFPHHEPYYRLKLLRFCFTFQ